MEELLPEELTEADEDVVGGMVEGYMPICGMVLWVSMRPSRIDNVDIRCVRAADPVSIDISQTERGDLHLAIGL